MTTEIVEGAACLHACQEGCGRPYDIITIQVIDGSTSFFCIPCFMGFAHQVMKAMVEPDDSQVSEVVGNADFGDISFVDPEALGYVLHPAAPEPAEDEFVFDGSD